MLTYSLTYSLTDLGFELTFAFDEIVAMGHKENVSIRDIQESPTPPPPPPPANSRPTCHTCAIPVPYSMQVNVEMESHEEKLAIMIRQSKEREVSK